MNILQLAKFNHHYYHGGIERISKSIEKKINCETYFAPNLSLESCRNILRLSKKIFNSREKILLIVHSPSVWFVMILIFSIKKNVKIIIFRHCFLSCFKAFYNSLETFLTKRFNKKFFLLSTSPNVAKGKNYAELFSNLETESFDSNFEKRNHFIFVGRDSWYKNIPFLFEIYSNYFSKHGNLKLIFCSNDNSRYKKFIKKNSLPEDSVEFISNISDSELTALLKKSKALLFPSNFSEEAFGIVQIEAIKCGCPLIANNIPNSGVGWIQKNSQKKIGILHELDHNNKQNWLDSLIYFDKIQKDEFEEISFNCYDYSSQFSEEKFIEKLTCFYKSIKFD